MFRRAVSQPARRMTLHPEDLTEKGNHHMGNDLSTLLIDVDMDSLRQLALGEQDASNAEATVQTVSKILSDYRASAVATAADRSLSDDVGKPEKIGVAKDK